MIKRFISAALCLLMLLAVPVSVSAEDEKAEFMKIYHIDCGRKYFSPGELCGIIDMLDKYDYSHLQLAFGNNGLRFLLDDMSVTVGGRHFESEEVCEAIREGNAEYTAGSTGELNQTEMDAIMAYAASKEVDIIPMLNSPGHMNALLYAMEKLTGEEYSYEGSRSTVDVGSAEGLEFTRAVLKKYVDYFAGKGCRYFNMGADEYANDVFNTGSMGFGRLIADGRYGEYADYLNSTAQLISDAGMIPMAFNDGIYFANTKTCGGREVHISTDILICYWQKGWGDYTTRSAGALAADGFEIINTNDDWYYVLGRRYGGFGLDFVLEGASETSCTEVAGDSGGELSPLGSMLCLWCDEPSAEFSEEEYGNLREVLRRFAISNPGYFELPMPELIRNGHPAYISGYPDGTVRPKGNISRAETAAVFYKLLTDESLYLYKCRENSFTDVDGDAWYNEAVSTLAAAGIIAGYEDGSFRPDAAVSRAEFAAIMSRFDPEANPGGVSFSDVPESHWAAEAISLAESMGWMGGYPDGSFRPSRSISRAEAAAVINRMLERAVNENGAMEGMNSWPDNPSGTWYYWDLQEAGTGHEFIRSSGAVPDRAYCYEKWTEIIK